MIKRLLFILPTILVGHLLAVNPLNSALDSLSTLDDHGIFLVGMDAAAPADGDTLAMVAGWKCMIWSADAPAATLLKQYDSTRKLIIYSSIDHGLKSTASAIDTSAPGNNWSDLTDEYSHHRKICNDSSKSYYSLFYHFADATTILLAPRTSGGFTYSDTVHFEAATDPISDDDSNSVVPDAYTGSYFLSSGTLDTLSVDTVGTVIYRSFQYQGTPQGSKVTRVYLDFSNPLSRYVERSYVTRAFAADYGNLGGTNNNVYGWEVLSDAGYHWDGIFLDNSSASSNDSPPGMTILSGGTIRCSRGNVGIWNQDSTRAKMNGHAKEYFTYLTDYCNNGANFPDGKAKITAANFGAWNVNNTNRAPITSWYNDSNKINLKVFEYSRWDGGYVAGGEDAYETGGTSAYMGRSMAQLQQMDSLARANDFYIMFGGRIDYINNNDPDWYAMKNGFLRSDWVRLKTAFRHRAIFAPQPVIATATSNSTGTFVFRPCSNSGGVAYAGLNYSPDCNDRAEVDTFVNRVVLPFMQDYDLGGMILDSSATVAAADAQGQTVNVWKTFWRKVDGIDTTYSRMYYFPRVSSAWDWRHTGNHYVNVIPPSLDYKRLEYDGTLTDIAGAVQRCYIGDQLILSYTVTGTPAAPGTKVIIQKQRTWPGADDALDPDPIP